MSDDLKVRFSFDGDRSAETTMEGMRRATDVMRRGRSADDLPAGLGADDLYPVPPGLRFKSPYGDKVDYIDAPDLEALAEGLMEQWSEMAGLEGLRIRYLWKAAGTSTAMGKCNKASGFWGLLAGVDFVVWLGAADVRDNYFTRRQVEALLYHELCHIGFDDEGEKPVIVPHDAEVFYAEFARYGVWRRDYQRFGQLALDGALGRGEGLQPQRYGPCPECGGPADFGEHCRTCQALAAEVAAKTTSTPSGCERCGEVRDGQAHDCPEDTP